MNRALDNLFEIGLPNIGWRYRAENIFGSLISARLGFRII